MKKSVLFLFLVLLLSCPLLAQEKTYDPIFDDPVFNDPGFDLGQGASGSLNYQRYRWNDCGSEAEGYWPDSANEQYGKEGPLGDGLERHSKSAGQGL